MKKNLLFFGLILFACLTFLGACSHGYEEIAPTDITSNSVFDVEKSQLNFAQGQSVSTIDVLLKAKVFYTNDVNEKVYLTKYMLNSRYCDFDMIKTTNVGDFTLNVTFLEHTATLNYHVDSYKVNLYLGENEPYLLDIVPTATLDNNLNLVVSIAPLVTYNYGTSEEGRLNDAERALRFCGWTLDGNVITGSYGMSRPVEGNETSLNLYAKYLSDAEFSNYDIRYDASGRKVFYGYTGSTKIDYLAVPESVTYIDTVAFTLGNVKEIHFPSTAITSSMRNMLDTRGLEKISVDSMNPYYASYYGTLYSTDLKQLILFPASNPELKFSSEIQSIMDYSFCFAEIKEITLPSSIRFYGDYAFAYSSIETVIGLNKDAYQGKDIFYESAYAINNNLSYDDGHAIYRIYRYEDGEEYILVDFYDETATTYTVNEKTTSINSGAFANKTSLVTVNFNEGLKTIGSVAFSCCTSLSSLDFPESLQAIGESAFSQCKALTTVYIPDVSYIDNRGVETPHMIADSLFRECEGLVSVQIADEIESLGSYAFYHSQKLATVNTPSHLTKIWNSCFANTALLSFEFIESINSIGNLAFSSTKITNVDLSQYRGDVVPERIFSACSYLKSVILGPNVKVIGPYSFYACTSLTSINFPEGLIEIQEYAFRSASLTSVELPESLQIIGYRSLAYTKISTLVLPDNVVTVGTYALQNCTNLQSIHLGASVREFGSYGVDGTDKSNYVFSSVNPVLYGAVNLKYITVSEENETYYAKDNILYADNKEDVVICAYNNPVQSITLLDTTKIIYPYAFDRQAGVKTIILNEGLLNIGKAAFYSSKSIASLYIPSSVEMMGIGIVNLSNITTFEIDKDNKCYASLNNLVYTADHTSVVFAAVTPKDDIVILDGCVSLAAGLFQSTKITSIVLPDSIKSIGDGIFQKCDILTEIHIGSGLEAIGANAFGGLKSLELITCSEDNPYYKVVDHKLYTKDGKKLVLVPAKLNETTVNILPTVTEIGEYAYAENNYLTTISIPDSVLKIDDYAFYNCFSYTYLYTGKNVNSLGVFSFGYTSLGNTSVEELIINNKLTYVIFGEGVTKISDNAFTGHYGITESYFECSYDQFINLMKNVGINNSFYIYGVVNSKGEYLTRIQRYIYSEKEPTSLSANLLFWHYVDGQIVAWEV